MIVLAIDTAAELCAACVYDSDTEAEKGRCVRHLGKGHAEHIMGVIAEALDKAGTAYSSLDRIAVSVGPGSFTGVRVGVAAARGLAMALNIPAVGVTTHEALAAEARWSYPRHTVLVVTGARAESLATSLFDSEGNCVAGPELKPIEAITEIAGSSRPVLAGDGAALVRQALGGAIGTEAETATADIIFFARVAAAKPAGEKPKPIYLRPPDARPQEGFALPRKRS